MVARAISLAFALAPFALLGACSNSSTNDAALDPFLCTQEDLGDGYQQLTDGSFSPGDLADLGPDARGREREFREAGMQRGKFVLFKQVLSRPPFDPPVNVVCQVIEFDSEESAREWVRGLRPDEGLVTTTMSWIPDGGRDFTTVDSDAGFPAASVAVARFMIRAGSGDEVMNARYQAANQGRLVFTIIVGEATTIQSEEQRIRLAEVLQARALRLKDTPVLR